MVETIPQLTTTSNSQFLQGIFGDCYQAAHVTGFVEDPGELAELGLSHYWGGNAWYRTPLEDPNHNNFFVISTFHQDEDGRHYRRKANFAGGFCMMIDDVGTKIDVVDMLGYPEPSWKLETSPGNYQYGYIFSEVELNRGKVESLLKGFVALGLVDKGSDPGMLGCTRYARLPCGSNTKAAYGQPFRHQLRSWKPEIRYHIDDLAQAFGFELSSYYQDETYPDAPDKEHDLIYQSIKRLGLLKSELRAGIYDMTCPWHEGHTKELDNGSAYLAPMGYRCHHGSCASRKGRDLLNWLHGNDPVYVEACQARIPFVAQAAAEAVSDSDFEPLLDAIDSGSPDSTMPAIRWLAENKMHLSPTKFEFCTRQIKDQSGLTLKAIRDTIKQTRSAVLYEHREKGILEEPVWADIDGDKPQSTFNNFRAICEYTGTTIKFNQMTHGLDCNITDKEYAPEDKANLELTHMRDMMQRYGLSVTRAGEWMNMYAHENAYHPFRDYLDSIQDLPFDPMCPMFEKLFGTLTLTGNEDISRDLLRRWLISVVAAVRGHGGIGMKGVLTLSGDQSVGKTSWFRNLFPGDLFCEGLVLDPHNKDTLINATAHLVCELGELDSTFKRDIPALKAFLSNQFDKIRHPYSAKISEHPRRTVFCATVNQTHFLVDQTGNSRFWPIEVLDCNFKEIENMRSNGLFDVLWHEIDCMYNAAISGRPEFKWWVDIAEMNILNEASEDFILHTAGEVAFREAFDTDAPAVHWMTLPEILDACGVQTNGAGIGNAQRTRLEITAVIKRLYGQRRTAKFTRDGERIRGYCVPQRRVKKMVAHLSVVETEPRTLVPGKEEFDFL